MRLIDADDLLDYGMHFQFGYNKDGILLVPLCDMTNSIRNAQTVDAKPVRHGRWEYDNTREKSYRRLCTACGKVAYHCVKNCYYSYCPNCGAKMDGGVENASD